MEVERRLSTSTAKHLTCRIAFPRSQVQADGSRHDKYVPPKKPYSFEAMLDDILEFAVLYLVENARLSLWMPTANDEEVELGIPMHHCLEIISVCVQPFNKCKLIG